MDVVRLVNTFLVQQCMQICENVVTGKFYISIKD